MLADVETPALRQIEHHARHHVASHDWIRQGHRAASSEGIGTNTYLSERWRRPSPRASVPLDRPPVTAAFDCYDGHLGRSLGDELEDASEAGS